MPFLTLLFFLKKNIFINLKARVEKVNKPTSYAVKLGGNPSNNPKFSGSIILLGIKKKKKNKVRHNNPIINNFS